MKIAIASVHALNAFLREHDEMLDNRHHPEFDEIQPQHPPHPGHTILYPFPNGEGYKVRTSEGRWRELPMRVGPVKIVDLSSATRILLESKLRKFARLDQIELKR